MPVNALGLDNAYLLKYHFHLNAFQVLLYVCNGYRRYAKQAPFLQEYMVIQLQDYLFFLNIYLQWYVYFRLPFLAKVTLPQEMQLEFRQDDYYSLYIYDDTYSRNHSYLKLVLYLQSLLSL